MHHFKTVCLWVATVAGAAAATLFGILLGIPDVNDHAMVTVDKHARLRDITGPKLVFVGGSNLSYGLDSAAVQEALPFEVANMGLDSYLGVRFLLAEVEGALQPGDVVVLSFEHELFFNAPHNDFVQGAPTDQLSMVKARPASVGFLSWSQRLRVLTAVPAAAQQKLGRIGNRLLDRLRGRPAPDAPEFGSIEWVEGSRTGYNRFGDLTRHLDPRVPRPRLGAGPNLSKEVVRDDSFRLIAEFRARLAKRGITVLFVPPPTPAGYYALEQDSLESLYARLRQDWPSVSTLCDSGYVYPDDAFFDDISHLATEEWRQRRTARLIADIQKSLLPTRQSSVQ